MLLDEPTLTNPERLREAARILGRGGRDTVIVVLMRHCPAVPTSLAAYKALYKELRWRDHTREAAHILTCGASFRWEEASFR